MDITPVLSESAQRITAYGEGMIRVNEREFHEPVIIHPQHCQPWQQPGIEAAALSVLPAQLESVEILLIGTGAEGVFVPPSLKRELKTQTQAGIEIMDTGAACRTYNVLLAEGRKVAAALLPV